MMNQVTKFIDSGLLELYVLGIASPEETKEVERMAILYPEIRLEIDAISIVMEGYGEAHAVQPRATVKPLLMASIDYIERLQQGEIPALPPELTESTKPEAFSTWLEREDMQPPVSFADTYGKIIYAGPGLTTAIVWIKGMTDYEVHHDEHESFLILEGTCDFYIDSEVQALKPGDYISVPLHKPHWARITSEIPCKAILQRKAA